MEFYLLNSNYSTHINSIGSYEGIVDSLCFMIQVMPRSSALMSSGLSTATTMASSTLRNSSSRSMSHPLVLQSRN